MSSTNVSKYSATALALLLIRFIVTSISSVAIGSLLAQIVSNTDLDLVRGLLSLFLFLAVDYVTTFGMTRSKKLQELLRGRPVLCVFKGKILEDECRWNR
jgi:uncharacterized membrane protein YcaP (DUF421 family)